MKRIHRISLFVSTLVMLGLSVLLITAPAGAFSIGQIEAGNIYQIANLTQNVGFANPASANACDELEYSAELHNPDYATLNNVEVTVTLPSGAGTTNTSNLTTYAANGSPTTTTASATLNISSSQTVSYENGTTQLLNSTGGVIANLPDGITQGGINIGNLPGSTTVFVNFKAKVSCPPTTYTATESATVSASATANATANCAASDTTSTASATASGSASATVSATETSTISQQDADQKAQNAANSAANTQANQEAQANATANANTAAKAKCTSAPTPAPTKPTPTPPSTLVNTGPSGLIEAFGVTAIISTVASIAFLNRRLRRS